LHTDNQIITRAPIPAVRRSQRKPKLNRNEDFVYLANTETLDDPETMEEALSRADAKYWKEAMQREYSALLENQT